MNNYQTAAPLPRKELWIVSVIKAALYIVLYMGMMFAISTFDAIRLRIISSENAMTEDQMLESLLAHSYPIMIISALVTLLILVLRTVAKNRSLKTEFFLNRVKPSVLVLSFIAGISLNLTLSVLMSLLPDKVIEDYNSSMEINTSFSVYLMAAVIMAPIIEETIFRCFAITRMRRSLPYFAAVIISALAFGGVHGHWVQMLYAGTLGLVLALLFCNTESIFPSVVMHFAFNSVSLLSFLSEEAVGEGVYNTVNLIYGLSIVISVPVSIITVMLIVLMGKNKKPSAQVFEPIKYDNALETGDNGDSENAG